MSTPPATGVAAQPPRPQFFVNGPIDFLFVGGFSMLLYAVVALGEPLQYSRLWENLPSLLPLAYLLLWVCNYPHFAASTYRLYESKENIRQYPMTALVVPWFVLSGMVASFISPAGIAPYWIKLFMLWSPYHFSGQTVGVSLIYGHRAGYRLGNWQRLLFSTFIFGTFITTVLNSEIGTKTRDYYQVEYQPIGLPDWKFPGRDEYLLVDVTSALMYAGGIGFLATVLYRWLRHGQRPPLMLFIPALTQYIWFILGPSNKSYYEFVPFFHSLQYMFIAWAVRLKVNMDRTHAQPSLSYVLWESLRWGVVIFAGGAILFELLPYLGDRLNLVFAGGIITVGVQIHHFFVDGVIWKLRSKSVSSPLMVNLNELLHPAPRPQPSSG
jgi:hypothetical protein